MNGLPMCDILLPDGRRWGTCEIAGRFFARLRGLLGRKGLPDNHALRILRCNAVHTVGMKFNLDLIFLSSDGCVTRILRDIPPGRLFVGGGIRSNEVLEAETGRVDLDAIPPGTRLTFRQG
ncbi:MAG: DUF192 domain-containing protein [Kiritimatiellae bacterium]|nr:DUF192 domain-containing protein [Kiritimatiellia bacterium]